LTIAITNKKGKRYVKQNIGKLFIHPNYTNIIDGNDIALLELKKEVQYTEFLLPVCLPNPHLNIAGMFFHLFIFKGRHNLFPNETSPNVKIPNVKILNRAINLCKNPKFFKGFLGFWPG
jgi:hypothetical protein